MLFDLFLHFMVSFQVANCTGLSNTCPKTDLFPQLSKRVDIIVGYIFFTQFRVTSIIPQTTTSYIYWVRTRRFYIKYNMPRHFLYKEGLSGSNQILILPPHHIHSSHAHFLAERHGTAPRRLQQWGSGDLRLLPPLHFNRAIPPVSLIPNEQD